MNPPILNKVIQSVDLLHAADAGFFNRVQELVHHDPQLMIKCQHLNACNRAFNLKALPIHYACRSGHFNIVKYFVENNPRLIDVVDCEDWTPLHYACYNGHLSIVRFLVENKANVDKRDNYLNQKPIEFAMYRQFEEVVNFLDPKIDWKRRDQKEIETKGNVDVFRKKSNLFLGRYSLNEEQIEQIKEFRRNPRAVTLELHSIEDVELNNLRIDMILNHKFSDHIKRTMELSSIDENDQYLRSSTTSTNEHVIVLCSRT